MQSQQQKQQQSLAAASSGIESQAAATPDGAGTPRWLGSSSASWRARASPLPWLSAAAFREPPSPLVFPVGAPGSLAGLSRPATVGPGKSQAQQIPGHQQRPLGAVRTANSAHGAARRRARGTRAVGSGPHRSPTPEPPAGQGGYLVPSRGGRVTPQQMAAAAEASLGQSQSVALPSSLPMSTADAASHGSTVVHARNGGRYRTPGDVSGQSVPPETEVNGTETAVEEHGPNDGDNPSPSLEAATSHPAKEYSVKLSASDAGLHAAPLALSQEPLGPLRISATPVRAASVASLGSFPAYHQPAAWATGAAVPGGGGGVTSFSYMHFHNRPPPSEQPHPLYHSQQIQPSPRPRPVPSYSVDPNTSPNLLLSSNFEQQQQQQQQDVGPSKPLVSISDGAGCTTEIFPIKSILKRPGALGGSSGGGAAPVLLSAAARPQTAGGALKLQPSTQPLLLHVPSVQQQQQQQQHQPTGLQASATASDSQSIQPDSSAAPGATVTTPLKRSVRRSTSIQNGQLSLRARSQSAGPKRGVRFDMTSNSVHEYEPVPQQPLQPLPPYTADSEHWYRLMWKRLAEQ